MDNKIKIVIGKLGYALKIGDKFINASTYAPCAVMEGVGGSLVAGASEWSSLRGLRGYWNLKRYEIMQALKNPYRSVNGDLVQVNAPVIEWYGLTKGILTSLVGKTIEWKAPGYNRNYSGKDKVLSIEIENRRPIISESLEGDDLQYAFLDDLMDGEVLSYSDSFRIVQYKIID